MQQKILYTGLDPSRFQGSVHHVPFIKIQPRPFQEVEELFKKLCDTPDVLLTSRSAVSLFFQYAQKVNQSCLEKRFFAVGQATASLIFEQGRHNVLVAKQECSEGICELLHHHPPRDLFYPRASLAREVIRAYLNEHNRHYIEVILYLTHTCLPHPLPNLDHYEKIVLTSPSTVQAFFTCYPNIPKHLRFISIGPITKQALIKALQCTKQVDQIDD